MMSLNGQLRSCRRPSASPRHGKGWASSDTSPRLPGIPLGRSGLTRILSGCPDSGRGMRHTRAAKGSRRCEGRASRKTGPAACRRALVSPRGCTRWDARDTSSAACRRALASSRRCKSWPRQRPAPQLAGEYWPAHGVATGGPNGIQLSRLPESTGQLKA